jgi:hypothetical protein
MWWSKPDSGAASRLNLLKRLRLAMVFTNDIKDLECRLRV